MANRDRAFRRFKQVVKKTKVSRYWNAHVSSLNHYQPQTDKAIVGKVATTPCGCSCWMCGHQRKHFGLTKSEEVARQKTDVILGLSEIE